MSNLFRELPSPKGGIIGHRGVAGIAPENTLAGFRMAAAGGLTWVEFDIRRCASGEWVVIHDKILDRTTNGQGLVSEISYKTLKTLDAGSWFDPRFSQERIPLLKDALACLIELNLHPNIEIKKIQDSPQNKNKMAKDFLSQLGSDWPKSYPPPLISSFDLELLIILRKLSSSLPLGYVIQQEPEMGIKEVLKHHLNTLHCHHEVFQNSALLSTLIQKVPLLIYTVNHWEYIQAYLQAGVSAVFSDLTPVIS